MANVVMIASASVIAGVFAYAIANFVTGRAIFPDRPNGRSSHVRVTPRAGGFAIFGGFAAAMILEAALLAKHGVANSYTPFLLFGAAAFAFGAVDDARPIGAKLKLLAQVLIAAGFVAVFGAVHTIPAPFVGAIDLGLAAFPLTVFWIVAFMNAFNFMDGINGIAGACALFVLSALAVATAGGAALWAPPAMFLACALFGYLPLNFASGRLFMGDGGSQFVGFAVASLAILSGNGASEPVSRLFVPIAFLPFIYDVGFTLIHRIRRKRNILAAHQEHLYQLLVRQGRSHQAVTTMYLTLVVLSTTAAIVTNAFGADLQYLTALALLAAFTPLAFGVFRRAEAAGLLADTADADGADVDKVEPAKMAPPHKQAPAYPAAAE